MHLADSITGRKSREACCTNQEQHPRHMPHHITFISIANRLWDKGSLPVRKSSSVHRQTVQAAWCEENILDHVSYLQATYLLEHRQRNKMWCEWQNVFFGTVLDDHNKPLHCFLLLHHTQGAHHISSVQLKQRKTFVHAAKCATNELNHTAPATHKCVLCSLWLAEGGGSTK